MTGPVTERDRADREILAKIDVVLKDIKKYDPNGIMDERERIGYIMLDLQSFGPHPFYKNTLLRDVTIGYSTSRNVDVVQWNKDGLEFWRQQEGCFSCFEVTGRQKFSWAQLKALSETNEDVIAGSFVIKQVEVAKILKLEKTEYTGPENAKIVYDILKAELRD